MSRPTKNTNRANALTANRKYYIKQKLIGIAALILGIGLGALTENAGAAFIGIFFGLPLIFSREKILMTGEYWEEEHDDKARTNRNYDEPFQRECRRSEEYFRARNLR